MNDDVVVKMKFGSHLYGTDSPDSDIDIKEIFIPDIASLIIGKFDHIVKTSTGPANGKNSPGDIDHERISIQEFLRKACDGEIYALDMLHCENPISSSDFWEELVYNRKAFYTKNIGSYIGYVKHQAAKYGIRGSRLHDIKMAIESIKSNPCEKLGEVFDKLYTGSYVQIEEKNGERFYNVNCKMYSERSVPEYVVQQLTKMYDSYGYRAKLAETNEGIDWKALSHALRVSYQVIDIYNKGDFSYPLDQTQFIRDVKFGKIPFKEVSAELERLVDEVHVLSSQSTLQDEVDSGAWDQWLIYLYKRHFNI